MANLIEILITAIDGASGTLNKVATEVDHMGTSAMASGLMMVTAGAGMLAVAGGIGKIAESGAQFEQFSQIVQNNTTMTDAQLGKFKDTIIDLSMESGVAYEELGQGFKTAQDITTNTAASMIILDTATKSAVSTGADASNTTKILANAMHEYNLDVTKAADGTLDLAAVQLNASHVMGVMHMAASEGNLTLEDFAEKSGRTIGVASNLGVGLEDVSAAFVALTKHGYDAATANTQMVNILTHMINPTVAAKKEIKSLSEATGIDLVNDFTAAGLHTKGLNGVLEDLQLAFQKAGISASDQKQIMAGLDGSLEETTKKFIDQGLGQAQATQEAMKLINAQRGGLGLATLLGTAWGDYNHILHDLGDTQKVNIITEEQYAKVHDNAVNTWERTQQTLRAIAITVGTEMLPALTGVLSKVIGLAQGFLLWANAHKEVLGQALALIGIVLGVVGALTMLGGIVLIVGSTIGSLVGALGGMAAMLFGPVGLALAAGALAIWAYQTNWHGVGDTVRGAVSVVAATVPALVTAFKTGDFNAAFGAIITAIDKAFGAEAAGKVALFVSNALRVLQLLRDSVITVAQALAGKWVDSASIDPFVRGVGNAALKVREFALDAVHAFDVVKAAVPALIAAFQSGDFNAAFSTIITAVEKAFGAEAAGKVAIFVSNALRVLQLLRDSVITVKQALSGEWVSDSSIQPFVRVLGEMALRVREVALVVGPLLGAALQTMRDHLLLTGGAVLAVGALLGGVPAILVAVIAGVALLAGAWLTNFGNIQGITASAVAAVRAGLASVGDAMSALGTVGRGLANLIGPSLAAGFATLGPILAASRSAFDGLGSAAATLGPALSTAGASFATLGPILAPLGPALATAAKYLGEFEALMLAFNIGVIVAAVGGLAGLFTNTLAGAIRIVSGIIEIVAGNIRVFSAVVTGIITVISDLLHGQWAKAWDDAKTAASKAFDGIKLVALGLGDILIGAFQTVFGGILGTIGGFGAAAVGYFADLYQRTRGEALPWKDAMIKTFTDMSTFSIAQTQGMHDQVANLLDLSGPVAKAQQYGPEYTRWMMEAAQAASGMLGPFTTAAGAVGTLATAVKGYQEHGAGFNNSFGAMGGAATALASSMNTAAAAASTLDKTLQTLGSRGSELQGYLTTLQGRWDQLNVATDNGTHVTAAQKAEYEALAPSIQYLNGAIGANKDKVVEATLANVNHAAAVDGVNLKLGSAAQAIMSASVAHGNAALAANNNTTATAASGAAATTSAGFFHALGGAINTVPKTSSTTVDSPGALESAGRIAGLSLAIALVPKSFTITAHVDISGALNAISELDNHVPHSPAKKGPLSQLPNWQALFTTLPSAFAEATSNFVQFGHEALKWGGYIVDGLVVGMGGKAQEATAAATSIAQGVADVFTELFQIASPSKLMIGFGGDIIAGLTGGMDDAGKTALTTAAQIANGIVDAFTAANDNISLLGSQNGELNGYLTTLKAQLEDLQSPSQRGGDQADRAAQIAKVSGAMEFLTTRIAGNTVTMREQTLAAVESYKASLGAQAGVEAAAGAAGKANQPFQDLIKTISTIKPFHVGGTVDVSGGMASITALADMLPHSPAKAGPLSTLPNWHALFDFGPAIAQGVATLKGGLAQMKEAITTGMDEAAETAAKKAADLATSVAKAVTDALGAMAALANFDFTANTPSASAFGMLGGLVAAMVATIQAAAANFNEDGLKAAGAFADATGKVSTMVKGALDALAALASYDFTKGTPTGSAMGLFASLVVSLVLTIQQASADLDSAGVTAAATFADGAGKILAMLKAGVDAFAALVNFVAPPTAAIYAFGKSLRSAINDLSLVAEQVTLEATLAAAKFAEGAAKVLTMIGTGVKALTDLAAFQGVPTAAIFAFGKALRSAMNDLALVAEQVGAEGAAGAAKLADNASKVLAMVGTGVKALSDLVLFAAPTQASIAAFAAAVGQVLIAIADVAQTISVKGVAAGAVFATAAGTVLTVIGNGAKALMDLNTFVAPSKQAIDNFLAAALYVVQRFGEVALNMSTEGIKKTTDFSTAANLALGATKAGTDAFVAMAKLVVPSKEAIDALVIAIRYVVDQFAIMASQMSNEGLARTTAYATASILVNKALTDTLDLFKKLQEPPYKRLLSDTLDNLLHEFILALGSVKAMAAQSADFLKAAQQYETNMAAAAAALARGAASAGGGGVPSLGGNLPSRTDMGSGGIPARAGGGSVDGDTTYLVGERGPELFRPNRAGTVVSNSALRSGGGGGGGDTYIFQIGGDVLTEGQFTDKIVTALTKRKKNNLAFNP